MAENENEIGSHKEQPIIIKKVKKGGHGGHHGGAWKVAYADFVTAMMAFFIVMWILASGEDVKQAVAGYFQDPGLFQYKSTKGTPVNLNILPGAKSGSGEGSGSKPIEISFKDDNERKNMANAVSEGIRQQAISDSIAASNRVAKMGSELKNDFVQQMSANPQMKEILSAVKIEMTKEGLRIELIESKDALFFEVGSARLNKDAISILKQLGERISTFPNSVEIEGHTDARQYGKSSSYTNWELSNDRANAARRVLAQHLWNGQIDKVSGFADRKLRNAGNPFDVTNRRVSILIKQITANDFIKETNKQLQEGGQ